MWPRFTSGERGGGGNRGGRGKEDTNCSLVTASQPPITSSYYTVSPICKYSRLGKLHQDIFVCNCGQAKKKKTN